MNGGAGRARLTARGRGVLGAAGGLLLLAKLFGSTELAGLAAAAFSAVAAGAVLVGRAAMTWRGERWLAPARVAVGGSAEARLRFTNTDRRDRTRPAVASDGPEPASGRCVVPALVPGAMAEATYDLPTGRRGAVPVGPLSVSVSDVFGVVERRVESAAAARLVVHPRIHPVLAVPGSPTRETRRGSASPARAPQGDDFFALREYEVGDDLRRVHWRTTARLGDLMLRQDEVRVGEAATVLLDTRAAAHAGGSFERALEVAASVAAALVEDGRRLRFVTTAGFDVHLDAGCRSAAAAAAGGVEGRWTAVLEHLALVAPEPGPADRFALAVQSIRGQPSGPLVAVVGPAAPAELAAVSALRTRLGLVIIAHCADVDGAGGGPAVSAPGAVVVPLAAIEDFPAVWNAAVLACGRREPARR